MEDLFVPYEQALVLKELGFDEENILGYYIGNRIVDLVEYKFTIEYYHHIEIIPAPLYQQTLKWFRDTYNLHYIVCKNIQIDGYGYREVTQIPYMKEDKETMFESYREAELECLKKLIEIVKK